ncbi:MAG: PAS domain S-box protein, partial [Proteobacteria bacterium]|nr:PAS domain S-box protein [Pseudomonadota bacterium]
MPMSAALGANTTERPCAEAQTAAWFFENATDLFAVVTPAGRFLDVNPAWRATTGWSRESLIGSLIFDIIHPDSRPAADQAVRDLQRLGHASLQMLVAHKDGGWVSLKGHARSGPNGEFMGTLRDVTEETRVTAALAESQKVSQYLSHAAGVGQWWFDPRTETITWSEEWRTMLAEAGVSMSNEADFGRYCHPDDLPGIIAVLERAVDQGEHAAFEHRLSTEAGGWMHVRGHVWAERLDGGRHLLHGISQDVTALAEARDAAVDNDERSRRLIAEAPYALAVFDQDLRYQMASPRWITLFHLEERPFIGYSLAGLGHAPYAKIVEAQQCALAGETIRVAEDTIVDTLGHSYALRWEMHPWRNGSDRIEGVVMYVDDISAIVEARR